jgi:hypothetical protein
MNRQFAEVAEVAEVATRVHKATMKVNNFKYF